MEVVATGVAVDTVGLAEEVVGYLHRHAPVGVGAPGKPMDGFVRVFGEETEADGVRAVAIGAMVGGVHQPTACYQDVVFGIGHKSMDYHTFLLFCFRYSLYL